MEPLEVQVFSLAFGPDVPLLMNMESRIIGRSKSVIKLLERDDVCSYATLGRIGVAWGHAAPDVHNVESYDRLIKHLMNSNAGPVGLITVIEQSSTPRPEARDALISVFREHRKRLCAVFVVSTGGFAPAAQRAIITAVLMATQLRNRIRIVGSVSVATMWLQSQLTKEGALHMEPAQAIRVCVEDFCDTERERLAKLQDGSAARK